MQVTVETYGGLKNYLPGGVQGLVLELGPGTTVACLVARLGLPWEEVWQVAVNGQLTTTGHQLEDGDRLTIFAPVEGG